MKSFWRLALVVAAWCLSFGVFAAGCGDDDDDDSGGGQTDDDDNDDASSDDDDDNNDDASPDDDDDDNDDASPDDDDDNDDASPDDDDDNDDDNDNDDNDDATPDDWVAPWPQANVEVRDYDEAPAAGPLRLKAEDHDAWNHDHHQAYYGGQADVKFTDNSYSTPQSYGGWGDSCIWTGTYLGSQAMRYWVTGDAAAKENAIRAATALDGYLHVTGRTGFIARYWAPQESLMYQGDEWCDAPEQDRCHHWEDGDYAGDFWWGETSRDQYTGWFFGMALAYDLIDDEPTRAMIRANVTEVLDALIDQNWWIIDEAGEPTDAAPNVMAPMQLSWATIGYHIAGEDRFKEEVAERLKDSYRTTLRLTSIAFMNRYAQYYGNNLAHTNWYNILRLGKVYYSAADYQFMKDLFEQQVHTFTRLSHNPWFNSIFMSQGAYEPGRKDDPYAPQLVEDLTDFPEAPNVNYALPERTDFEYDQLSVLLDNLQTQFPWLEDLFGSVEPQAKDAFPVPEQCSAGFMFQKNPFQFEACGVNDDTDVNPGVDYLIAYWLASYSKFLGKDQ